MLAPRFSAHSQSTHSVCWSKGAPLTHSLTHNLTNTHFHSLFPLTLSLTHSLTHSQMASSPYAPATASKSCPPPWIPTPALTHSAAASVCGRCRCRRSPSRSARDPSAPHRQTPTRRASSSRSATHSLTHSLTHPFTHSLTLTH
jgi:hypothetical protein